MFLVFCAKLAKKLKDVAAEVNFECLLADEIGRSIGWKSKEYQERIEFVKEEFFDEIEENQLVNSEVKSNFYYRYGFHQQSRASRRNEFFHKFLKIESEKQIDLGKDGEQTDLEKVDQVLSLTQCGRVWQLFNDREKATDYYNKALTKSKECLGNHELTLNCYKRLGDTKIEKDNKEALKYYNMAKETHEVLGITDSSVSSVYLIKNRGCCLSLLGQHQEAVEVLTEACDVIEKRLGDNNDCKFKVYFSLAEALNRQAVGCPEAVEYARKALEVGSNLDGKKIIYMMKKMKIVRDSRRTRMTRW